MRNKIALSKCRAVMTLAHARRKGLCGPKIASECPCSERGTADTAEYTNFVCPEPLSEEGGGGVDTLPPLSGDRATAIGEPSGPTGTTRLDRTNMRIRVGDISVLTMSVRRACATRAG